MVDQIIEFPADRVAPGRDNEDPGTLIDMADVRNEKRIEELEALVAELRAEIKRLRKIITDAGLSPQPPVDVEMSNVAEYGGHPLGEDED